MSEVFPAVESLPDSRGFFRVTAPASPTFRWLLGAVDDIAAVTERNHHRRLLLDLSAIIRPPGQVEQSILGEHAARSLMHCEKVASLVAQGTRTGTSEAVAQALGMPLRVFTSEADAIEWLES